LTYNPSQGVVSHTLVSHYLEEVFVTFVSRPGLVMCLALGMLPASHARAQTIERPREWTLDEVLKIALSEHPLVEAAQARVAAAEGSRAAAGTFPNPVGTLWVENAAFPGQHTIPGLYLETSAYVTLPLEPFFQRKPRVRAADELVKAAGAELTGERRRLALDTAHAFYRVALAQVGLDAADEHRTALEQLVSYNRTRVTQGATAELELIRVQVELDRATTNAALARVDVARSWAELRPFIGATATPSMAAAGTSYVTVPRVRLPDLASAAAASSTLSDLLARARERRPEILAARSRVAAADADTAYQRSLAVRQIGATFGFKQSNGESSMIAALSVPIPLFDRNQGEVRRAASDAIAAQKDLAWSERRVEAEVQGAYDAAQQLRAQAGALQQSIVDRAAEAHRITLAAYQEGATSLLQVLDASRTLVDARLLYYRMLLGLHQGLFDLAMAAGAEPFTAVSVLDAAPPLSTAGSVSAGGTR
jgi:cobalt-zinc-cadmium efflux system outer membrane protein